MSQALEQAKNEHDALDWSIGRSTVNCEVCDEAAILVSERRTPEAGPLVLDGYETHVDDGDAYYHRTDSEED